MISVEIRSSSSAITALVDPNTTLAQVFSDHGIDTNGANITLDGNRVAAGKTFAELGVAPGASVKLSAIVKANGAA